MVGWSEQTEYKPMEQQEARKYWDTPPAKMRYGYRLVWNSLSPGYPTSGLLIWWEENLHTEMLRTKPRWMIDSTTSEDWNEAVGYS